MKNNQPKSKKPSTAVATTPPPPKSKALQVDVPQGDTTTRDRLMTNVVAQGLAANAATAIGFSAATFGELSLTDMVASLKEQGGRINTNDMAGAEQLLSAQALALNSIFGELSRRAALNMGEYMDATERYLRLALKAQGQCRATLETLAAIKNPPVVFAKQANISNGPQQVNNGTTGPGFATSTRTPAPAHEETGNQQTKLLEETQHGGTVLDAGATGAAAGRHPELEAVGALHRSQEPRRQKQG